MKSPSIGDNESLDLKDIKLIKKKKSSNEVLFSSLKPLKHEVYQKKNS